MCVRPTPEWQKGIGSFLLPKSGQDENTTPTDVTVDVHIHPCAAESATSARWVVDLGPSYMQAVVRVRLICNRDHPK